MVTAFPVKIICGRRRAVGEPVRRSLLKDLDQTLFVSELKRAEKYGIDQTVDGDVGSDPKAKREDYSGGKTG